MPPQVQNGHRFALQGSRESIAGALLLQPYLTPE